jgi:hypothetical protein
VTLGNVAPLESKYEVWGAIESLGGRDRRSRENLVVETEKRNLILDIPTTSQYSRTHDVLSYEYVIHYKYLYIYVVMSHREIAKKIMGIRTNS